MNNMYAKIHSIESFGTVDGPGIRYVLFMQGCPLKCKYCQNRDTWDTNNGKQVSLDEIFNNIMHYKNYIKNGGVTISGGEPLLQASFLIELFKKLKKEKIHTCIDTSGMFSITDEIKELINLTDLFLLDIKHIDSSKCKELVGMPNIKELEFAKFLSSNNKHMWIRQVLVPGITDTQEDLIKLKNFIKSLNTVDRVEVLPYHTLGKYKWTSLGLNYNLENIRGATDEDVLKAKQILEIN